MLVRNLFGIAGAAALYVATLYVLYAFELKGRDALLLLFFLHVGFGISGYFIFSGRIFVRSLCVFLVVVAYGVVSELLVADSRHAFVQVFVATAFGVLSAVATPGGKLLGRIWRRSRGTEQA